MAKRPQSEGLDDENITPAKKLRADLRCKSKTCPERFTTEDLLNDHVVNRHGGKICQLCGTVIIHSITRHQKQACPNRPDAPPVQRIPSYGTPKKNTPKKTSKKALKKQSKVINLDDDNDPPETPETPYQVTYQLPQQIKTTNTSVEIQQRHEEFQQQRELLLQQQKKEEQLRKRKLLQKQKRDEKKRLKELERLRLQEEEEKRDNLERDRLERIERQRAEAKAKEEEEERKQLELIKINEAKKQQQEQQQKVKRNKATRKSSSSKRSSTSNKRTSQKNRKKSMEDDGDDDDYMYVDSEIENEDDGNEKEIKTTGKEKDKDCRSNGNSSGGGNNNRKKKKPASVQAHDLVQDEIRRQNEAFIKEKEKQKREEEIRKDLNPLDYLQKIIVVQKRRSVSKMRFLTYNQDTDKASLQDVESGSVESVKMENTPWLPYDPTIEAEKQSTTSSDKEITEKAKATPKKPRRESVAKKRGTKSKSSVETTKDSAAVSAAQTLTNFDMTQIFRIHECQEKGWSNISAMPSIDDEPESTIIAASCLNVVAVVDIQREKIIQQYSPLPDDFTCLSWSRPFKKTLPSNSEQYFGSQEIEEEFGCILAVGDIKGRISLLYPYKVICYEKLLYHSKEVTCLEFHPTDKSLMMSGSNDGNCILWRVDLPVQEQIEYASSPLKKFSIGGPVKSLSLSPAADFFLVSGSHGYVAEYKLPTAEDFQVNLNDDDDDDDNSKTKKAIASDESNDDSCIHQYTSYAKKAIVDCIRVIDSDRFATTALLDNCIRIFSRKAQTECLRLDWISTSIQSMRFTVSQGKLYVPNPLKLGVLIYDLNSKKGTKEYLPFRDDLKHNFQVMDIAVQKEGSRILSITNGNFLITNDRMDD